MNCINIKLPQFQALANESGLHPAILSAKMSIWMDNNKTDEWPTLEQLGINKISEGSSKKEKINAFLSKLGFDVQSFEELKSITGYDAISATDLIGKLIMLTESSNNLSGLSKEAAYVGLMMLGSKNKIKTDLLSNIQNIDNYQELYNKYKERSTNLNDYKIKELIIVDLLAEAIVNYENSEKQESTRVAEYWSISGSTKLIKTVKYNLLKLARKIKQALRVGAMSSDEVNSLVSEIASDMLNGVFSKYSTEISSDAQLTNFNRTLDNNPDAKTIVDKLNSLGAVLTGSLSLREQGTLYRTADENMHDLDFSVPFSVLSDSDKKLFDNSNDAASLHLPGFSMYDPTSIISSIANSEYVNNILNEFPGSKVTAFFNKGGAYTVTLSYGDTSIDLFFSELEVQTASDNKNLQAWRTIFEAKIRMGRAKDMVDMVNYIPYNQDTSNITTTKGMRHFVFKTINMPSSNFTTQGRDLHLNTDPSNKQNSIIFTEKEQDNNIGILESDQFEDTLGSDTSFTTDSKSFYEQLIELGKKVAQKGSKEGLRAVYAIANALSKRTGINFNVISSSEAKKINQRYQDGDSGMYDRSTNTAYIIAEYFDETTPIHEIFSHPFLELIRNSKEFSGIFEKLYKEAMSNMSKSELDGIVAEGLNSNDTREEIVAHYIDSVIKSALNNKNTINDDSVIVKFFKAFAAFIKNQFGITSDINNIKIGATGKQLASWILYGTDEVNLITGEQADNLLNSLNNSKERTPLSTSIILNTSHQAKLSVSEVIPIIKEAISKPNGVDIEESRFMMVRHKHVADSSLGMKTFSDIKSEMANAFRTQLSSIKKREGVDVRYTQKIQKLVATIEESEDIEALIKFIEFAGGTSTQEGEVDKMEKTMIALDERRLRNEKLDSNIIDLAKADFIDMYRNMLKSVESIFAPGSKFFDGVDSNTAGIIRNNIDRIAGKLNNMDIIYDRIFMYQYQNVLLETAAARGDESLKHTLGKNTFEIDHDFSFLFTVLGAPKYSNISQLSVLSTRIKEAKARANSEFTRNSNILKLIALAKSYKKSHLLYTSYNDAYEVDDNGVATGYLVSPLKYGVFLFKFESFKRDLQKKYKLNTVESRPETEKLRSEYDREIHDYLVEHSERMFKPAYYEARLKLSELTRNALDEANDAIHSILSKYMSQDGTPDTINMTRRDSRLLQSAKMNKRNLSSKVNANGELKTGVDLIIAEEISEMNESLFSNGSIKRKPSYDKFNKVLNRYLSEAKTDEDRARVEEWRKKNTAKTIKPEFYELLESIPKRMPMEQFQDEYEELYKTKMEILKRFRDPDTGDIVEEMIDDVLKKIINDIDKRLDEIKAKTEKTDGLKFSDVARVEVSERFEIEKKKIRDAGNKLYAKWLSENPTADIFEKQKKIDELSQGFNQWMEINTREIKGSDGNYFTSPASFWTKIVPINESFIEDGPNSTWSEIDKTSSLYNENYNENLAENGLQPKSSIYDNSKAYSKLKQNKKLHAIVEAVMEVNRDANSKYHYLTKPNPLRIAQVTGPAYLEFRTNKSFVSKLLRFMFKWAIVEDNDLEYGHSESNTFRADGSKSRNIPTAYRKMLTDTGLISRDLPGITAMYLAEATKFKHLSKIMPDIEIIKSGIERTKIVKNEDGSFVKKANVLYNSSASTAYNKVTDFINEKILKVESIKKGGSSNLYIKTLDLIEDEVYGKEKDKWLVNKNGKTKIDAVKFVYNFLGLAAAANLSWNYVVIAANAYSSEKDFLIEAICKYNFSAKSYAKANKEFMLNSLDLLGGNIAYTNNNKIIVSMKLFNVMADHQNTLKGMHGNSLSNFIKEHIWFGPYTAQDFTVKSRATMAMMFDTKWYNGKFYSRQEFIQEFHFGDKKTGNKKYDNIKYNLYDSFSVDENGAIMAKPGLEDQFNSITEDLISELSIRVNRLASTLDGMLTPGDKTRIFTSTFGRFLTMHRQFIIMNVQERLGSSHYSYELGDVFEPQYTAVYNRMSILGRKMIRRKISELEDHMDKNPHRAKQVRKTIMELLFMVAISIVVGSLKYRADDEDEEERLLKNQKISANDILYTMALRFAYESNALYSPQDMYSILKNPTAAQGSIDAALNLIGVGDEDDLDDLTMTKSSPYYGLDKRTKNIIKMLPIRHIFEFSNSKSLDSKNRYLLKDAGWIHNTVDDIMTTNKEAKAEAKKVKIEELMKIAEKNIDDRNISGMDKQRLLLDVRNKLDNMK